MSLYEAREEVRVNGVSLWYAAVGSGRPVVLVHGNGESHDLFETEIDQLTAVGYRVYAPDSRGHGASGPVTEYHYADMAEDIFQFIQALALDAPVLYGHSDGGIIGLLLALRHPGALSALAISGTNLSPAGLDPAFLAWCREQIEKRPDPLITLMLTEPCIDPRSLAQITIPVLVTVGEHDLILPEETETIVSNLPNAHRVVVKGEDHGSYIEHSEIMGSLLLDFLQTINHEEADMYEIKSERLNAEEYIDFLKRTNLGSQYPKERFNERIDRLLKNASISLAARNEEKRLIGALLGVTDFAYWLFVTDLGVDRAYERQGIGRSLMKTALALAGGEKDVAVYLVANEKAVPFYEKLGMEKADSVMQYNHVEWTDFTVE